jgi:hypothetical protein
MNVNKHIISYLAGYFDGDGYFGLSKKKAPQSKTKKVDFYFSSEFCIGSTDKPVLNFFKKHFGGNVLVSGRKETKSNWKIQYKFILNTKESVNVAKMMLPFLVEKKEECKCYIDFFLTECRNEKELLVDKMNNLKTSNIVTKKNLDLLKKNRKTKKISFYDYSYLAGFIDAECSLGLYRYEREDRENFLYFARFRLTNTKFPCFFFLVSRFGGSLTFNEKKGNNRPKIRCTILGENLSKILLKTHPFLVTKKQICQKLIDFRKLVVADGDRDGKVFRDSYKKNLIERDKLYHKIKELNTRQSNISK